jgi:glycerol uptake facilitator-like aquaporin
VAAFGFGLALLGGLYAFGEVSGGHFNPAVSIAMFLDKRLSGAPPLGAALAWLIHSRVIVPAAAVPPAPVAEVLAEGPEGSR